MRTWTALIIDALKELNGQAHLSEIYSLINNKKPNAPKNFKAIIRRELQEHSSDTKSFLGKEDLFYRDHVKGRGHWGLRAYKQGTTNIPIIASKDLRNTYNAVVKKEFEVTRVIRDTQITKDLKKLYEYKCQICDLQIKTPYGYYVEAHHIKPLGSPHNGPDHKDNILIVCPNHHAMLDYLAIKIERLSQNKHSLNNVFINYHNTRVDSHN